MIRNYLKIAFRYLAKYKGYTFINVLGLAVGITCCILIMLFVKSEWSFDRFHPKADRIYRAWLEEHY
ncbi:MAG: ABC transporter permease, partial [Bacteroidota bacterium]|nr:ABC transporter permease [Bacteroidota bacterium]